MLSTGQLQKNTRRSISPDGSVIADDQIQLDADFQELATLSRNPENTSQVNTARVVDLSRVPSVPITMEETDAAGPSDTKGPRRSTRERKQTDFY